MDSAGAMVAGVDEAGRGPLAGPVMAAAVILPRGRPIVGLDDSKRLSPLRRRRLEPVIKERALRWHVAYATVDEIDRLNILKASLLAMRRAVEGLGIPPALVLVDGNRDPGLGLPTRMVVGGDRLHAEISAASILAKECRDRMMRRLAGDHPEYGFERHKGYPTRAHLDALERHGPCVHHRRSFSPVQRVLGSVAGGPR